MTSEELLAYCLGKPGAWEDEPWEGDVVVKVAEKIFAFLGDGSPVGVKAGANRDEADEWLLRYPDDAKVPAFKVEGKAIAGYAYFKNHCSYFPHSGSALRELADELDSYDWSPGTLKFPVDHPLPKSLVTRLVEVRLDQLGHR